MESRGVAPRLRLVERKRNGNKISSCRETFCLYRQSVSYHTLTVSSSVTVPPSPPPPQLSPAPHNITALSGALLTLLSKSSLISYFFSSCFDFSPSFFLLSSLHLIFLTLYAYFFSLSSSSSFFWLSLTVSRDDTATFRPRAAGALRVFCGFSVPKQASPPVPPVRDRVGEGQRGVAWGTGRLEVEGGYLCMRGVRNVCSLSHPSLCRCVSSTCSPPPPS